MQLSASSLPIHQSNWQLSLFTGYLPLQSIDTFHYSKTFHANLGINSLTAAAAPLFILITKLYDLKEPLSLDTLQRELIHEIRAFECNAMVQHYNPHIILAARYALVATLDETIDRMPWSQAIWRLNYGLTRYFYAEQAEYDFFFSFLTTLIDTVNTPVEVLEFCYVCLNLGFLGIHRTDNHTFDIIQRLSNHLFALINRQKSKSTPIFSLLKQRTRRKNRIYPIPRWLLASTTLLIGISIYLSFNYIMSTSVQPLYAKLNQIVHKTAIS